MPTHRWGDYTPSGHLGRILDDKTPQLGGMLDGNGFTFNGAVAFEAKAGEALSKGNAVYVSGVSGNKPVVMKADADDAAKMPAFGIAETDASLNANVNVVTFGTVYNIDTSAYSAGDELYVSTTAGELTATKPTGATAKLQNIGKVIRSHASAGSIKVGGAGRTNAVPNLDDGTVFIGDSNNQAEQRALVLADISDYTAPTETDPVYTASSWYSTTNNSSNWDTAYSWGDHSTQNYAVTTGDTFTGELALANNVKVRFDNTNDANYDVTLGSYYDYDAFFQVKDGGGVTRFSVGRDSHAYVGGAGTAGNKLWDEGDFTSTNISNWNTAYGWGNHASAGYYVSSTANNLSTNRITFANNETSAVSSDGHLAFDVNDSGAGASLGTYGGSYPSGWYFYSGGNIGRFWTDEHFSGTNVANWQTAYGWGNHASAGYAPLLNPDFTGDIGFTNQNTNQIYFSFIGGACKRLTTQGGLVLGVDSSVVLHAGDQVNSMKTKLGIVDSTTAENLYATADGSVFVSTNYQTAGSEYNWAYGTNGALYLPTGTGATTFGTVSLSGVASPGLCRVTTTSGYVNIGPANTTYCHFSTDRGNFYFNAGTQIDGYGLRGYDTSTDCRFPIFYDLNDTAYYCDPASTSRLNVSYNNETSHLASHGRGVRFWNSDSYKIYMSAISNATWGGDVANSTGSDYAMYFRMTGGTNRGFIFRNNTTNVAKIDGAGRATFSGLSSTGGYLNFTYNTTGGGGMILYDSGNVRQVTLYGDGAGGGGILDNDAHWGYRQRTGTSATEIRCDNNNELLIYTSYVRAAGSFRGPIFYDYNNTTYYMDPSSTGTSIRCAGNIIAYYSDERLKNVEGNIENALDKVCSLNGFYYRANEKAQKLGYKDELQVGLSAQEVQKVLPEVIKDAPADSNYMTLDYAKTVPLLVEAIKELKAEIEELKAG